MVSRCNEVMVQEAVNTIHALKDLDRCWISDATRRVSEAATQATVCVDDGVRSVRGQEHMLDSASLPLDQKKEGGKLRMGRKTDDFLGQRGPNAIVMQAINVLVGRHQTSQCVGYRKPLCFRRFLQCKKLFLALCMLLGGVRLQKGCRLEGGVVFPVDVVGFLALSDHRHVVGKRDRCWQVEERIVQRIDRCFRIEGLLRMQLA